MDGGVESPEVPPPPLAEGVWLVDTLLAAWETALRSLGYVVYGERARARVVAC